MLRSGSALLSSCGRRSLCSFSQLGVPPHFVSRLSRSLRITEPTAVQRAALGLLISREPARPPPRSLVIRWSTGSGKTLAYMLPLLGRITPGAFGVQAVIVTPTRELCLQTLRVLNVLVDHGRANKKGNRITVGSVMGRVNVKMESELQHHPPDILIGTPQPLGALFYSGTVPMTKNIAGRTLVLDEIDALSEKFRWPHVARILAAPAPLMTEPPIKRKGRSSARKPNLAPVHSVSAAGRMPLAPHPPKTSANSAWSAGSLWLLSADAPRENCARALLQAGHPPKAPLVASTLRVPSTLRHLLISDADLSVGQLVGELLRPRTSEPANVVRDAIQGAFDSELASGIMEDDISAGARTTAHESSIYNSGDGTVSRTPSQGQAQALVFVSSGLAADQLVSELTSCGVSAAAVHSADGAASGSKRERHRAMKKFEEGQVRVLAATEMLAHGVDIRGVTHVLNACLPTSAGAYLHRAGRTGRTGGGNGTVISMARDQSEVEDYRRFARELGIRMVERHVGSTLHPVAKERVAGLVSPLPATAAGGSMT